MLVSGQMEEMKEKISDLQLTVEKLTIENEVLLCKEASLEEFVLEVEEKLRSCEQALASALEVGKTLLWHLGGLFSCTALLGTVHVQRAFFEP